MSDLEKRVMKVMKEAVPLLTENEQYKLIGFGEGLLLNPAIKKEEPKEQTKEQKPA